MIRTLAAVVRLAVRDLWQHRVRSLLIVLLVALPVVLVGGADVAYRAQTASAADIIDGQLAGSDALIVAPTTARWVDQEPGSLAGSFYENNPATQPNEQPLDAQSDPERPASVILSLLPAGMTVTPFVQGTAPLRATPDGRYRSVTVDQLDVRSPAGGGRYHAVSGALPTGPQEIALTAPLADELGVHLHQHVRVGAPAQDRIVVGIVEAAVQPRTTRAVLALPGSFQLTYRFVSGHLAGGGPVTWPLISALNRQGVYVFSRAAASTDSTLADTGPDSAGVALGTAVAVVLALLQITLLAGPAFALGARRAQRTYAVLSAVGAGPAQVVGSALLGALVLGLIGAVAGAVVGATLAVRALPWLAGWTGLTFPGTRVPIPELLAIAALGTLSAVLAALPPAFRVARATATTVLRRRPSGRGMLGAASGVGTLAFVAGSAAIVGAATRPVPADAGGAVFTARGLTIGLGLLAMLVGLLLATPLVVRIAARAATVLPAVPRLALRHLARQRGSGTSAVAAVIATAAVAATLACLMATQAGKRRAEIVPPGPSNIAELTVPQVPGKRSPDPAELTSLVTSTWPTATVVAAPLLVTPSTAASDVQAVPVAGRSTKAPFGSAVVVGDESVLRNLMGGRADAAAARMLAAGGAVVFDPAYALDGGLTLRVSTFDDVGTETRTVEHHLAARSVTAAGPWTAIVAPATAARLGLTVGPLRAIITAPGALDVDGADAVQQAGLADGYEVYVWTTVDDVGSHPSSWLPLGVGALIIAVVVAASTALRIADAGAELDGLLAIGATASLRRQYSGWAAAATTTLGCVLGGLAGLLPAWGIARLIVLVGSASGLPLVVPWRPMMLTGLGLAVLAFAVAALFTRGRSTTSSRI